MYITTKQAAEICGVTNVTIQNLCKAHAIKYRMKGNVYMVDSDDIEKYNDKINKVYDVDKSIDNVIAERNKYLELCKEARKDAEKALEDINLSPRRVGAIKEVLTWFLRIYDTYISFKDRGVIDDFLNGYTISDISDRMGVSRQTGHSRFWGVARRIMNIKRRDEEMQKEIASLKDQVEKLQKENIRLTSGVTPTTNELSIINRLIEDECVSVRLLNICKTNGIKTIGELARTKKEDICKLRNCGKKVITEMTELLDKYDLTFGMSTEKLVKNVSTQSYC